MFIANNQKPSYQSFHKLIYDDLTMNIDIDVFCINGTKYEANTNKNTFI